MKITAFVREDLRGYTAMQEKLELDVKTGATALEVALGLALPEVDIRLYVVNGANATKTAVLKAGDTVEFYPLITGG